MRKIPVYTHPAAGWSALIASSRKLLDYQAFKRGSLSVFSSNQPDDGFDCPGCAWPDHKTHKSIDVCETGIKVLASDTMTTLADADFFGRHTVTELQNWTGYELEHSGRLGEPVAYDAESDHYLPISWEDAYTRIASRLKQLDNPDKALFYTSGRVTNEPAFLFQLFVRCFGTNNLPDCSNMCHEPTSVMLGKQLGVGKATVTLEDFEKAKLIIMFGQNPATNHPRMLEMLAHAHKQGCKILSVNPMREQGLTAFRNPQKPLHMVAGQSDKMVDSTVQIKVGGDVALLTGLAKYLIDKKRINTDFITAHTSGFESLSDWLRAQSWQDIIEGSGISKHDIENIARMVADSPATICTWGMGITQHVQGEDNVAMITNLLLLMGMIGIDGGGASPVRGHSNVQGDRTMGIHERPKQKLLDSLERVFDVSMPQEDGLDVVEGAKAMIRGELEVFMSMGGNYSTAAPESSAIQQALTTHKLNVFVATKLNQTMLYPGEDNIILPCLSRTERLMTDNGEQFTTIEDSMCKIVRSKGSLKPVSHHLKSEAQIIADLATHLFADKETGIEDTIQTSDTIETAVQSRQHKCADIPWQTLGHDFNRIRDYISDAIDGFEDFNTRIREAERGFYLYHPARHREWNTDTGKAQFEVPQYPINYAHSKTKITANSQTLNSDEERESEYSNEQGTNEIDSNKMDNNRIDSHADIVIHASVNRSIEQDRTLNIESKIWQLTSVRSHDQFNTMIFGFNDRYRQTNRRDVLFMHPDDIIDMGWRVGQSVVVSRIDSKGNKRQLGPLIVTEMDIMSGSVATYYPECNDLIDLDTHAPDSRTPAYKSLQVTLEQTNSAPLETV